MKIQVGPIFAMLRKMKNLTLEDVTLGSFSVSQQSKFERGESDLTIDKFLSVLENSKIYLDEFQDVYENYQLSDDAKFHKELGQANRVQDLNTIKKWVNFWTERADEEPYIKYFQLNKVSAKVALAETAGGLPYKEDLKFLGNYLESVGQWGRYELFIFSICQHYLSDDVLKFYGDMIFERSSFYENIHHNRQMVIISLLNLVDTWLGRKNLGQALIYLNRVKSIGIDIDFFDESITLRYHEGWYLYLQGDKGGKDIMLECARDTEKYGYSQQAQKLYQEIERLK